MSTSQKPKEHRLNLRLSDQEWNKIHKLSSKTTCRSVSEYCRKVLLNEPVRVFQRNQSFDDFEEELVPLLPILKTYGDDFAILIKKLTSMDNAGEIKNHLDVLNLYNERFLKTTSQIKELLIKISDACAQK